ncbi:MAG: NAD(P)/FAD-dependent oxidoreductase [Bacillota bacterium]
MREYEVVVVGGGPAGLCAAREVGSHGAEVLLLDRNARVGGQLIKQTHRFFGSRGQHAGTRGIDIVDILLGDIEDCARVVISPDSDVLGYYSDGVLSYHKDDVYHKVRPQRLVVATGASERPLSFPGCDLPGVYGAGAVQTLMNVHGVRPGKRVLMIGSGNIGLIVSYQLMQAGVEVAAIIEAASSIGGYSVHASKVRRLGVPILTSHTVAGAIGDEYVEGATLVQLDADWQPVAGTETEVECDAICLAVGLSPLADLLWQAGCTMGWVPELGGYVPTSDETMSTSVSGIYVAGDARGIEEASAAMMEGTIVGLSCAHSLGYVEDDTYRERYEEIAGELDALRSGPTGGKIRSGLEKLGCVCPRQQVLVEGSDDCC